MASRCETAFVRTNGWPTAPLARRFPRDGVIRIEDGTTGRWAEYDVTRWRVRRIDEGQAPDAQDDTRHRPAGMPDLARVAAALTLNAAVTLRTRDRPIGDDGFDRPHTGPGRYTALAARGVFSALRATGCATETQTDQQPPTWRITPLGEATAAFLRENWDRLRFRDPANESHEKRLTTMRFVVPAAF